MKKNDSDVCNKNKIWIDLDNTPHVVFFDPIIKELEKQGYPTFLTARDCFQVCGLADLHNLQYKKTGHHYGKNKFLKVAGTIIRSLQLLPIALKEKPTLAISHGSRSQQITASFLGIPSILILDYEYAQTLPFIKINLKLVPEVLKSSDSIAVKGCIQSYPGIKEDVYVPFFKPDKEILKELGINEQNILVTIRPPATEAHYHNPESEKLFDAIIEHLGNHDNIQMVILPRNEIKQTAMIKEKWAKWCLTKKIIIPDHVVDGLNLMWHSDLVISGGGTMNREAAALGVPVYSIFRGTIGAVDHYLSNNGRLTLLESLEDVKSKVKVTHRNKSDDLVNKKNHDALLSIVSAITSCCSQHSTIK